MPDNIISILTVSWEIYVVVRLPLLYYRSMKNPTTATLLNIIPGLGYIYVGGARRVFGAFILIATILSFIAATDPLIYTEEYINSPFRIWDFLGLGAAIIYVGAFMYDVHEYTHKQNAAITKIKSK